MTEQTFQLKDDFELLDMMLIDSRRQPPVYKAGLYWSAKAKNAANEIKRCGMQDFRGSSNLIGMSYSDNVAVDMRNAYNHGYKRLIYWLSTTYPLCKMFESQVRLTEGYANAVIKDEQESIKTKLGKINSLFGKYTVPYSLLGNCLRKVEIDGYDHSIHYLSFLERHDNIASHINFDAARSVFEIGGGFGANTHILLENHKNIKKVLYLDIPPNLYIGTQYLKSFYGNSVLDYKSSRHLNSIKFSSNNELEIFCIAPWQIEKLDDSIDIFMNSHSFVEMPHDVVKNYVDKINGFPDSANMAIALTAYDGFDLDTTFHPNELPNFFNDRKFHSFEKDTLLNSSRKNIFFVSPGKFSSDGRK